MVAGVVAAAAEDQVVVVHPAVGDDAQPVAVLHVVSEPQVVCSPCFDKRMQVSEDLGVPSHGRGLAMMLAFKGYYLPSRWSRLSRHPIQRYPKCRR